MAHETSHVALRHGTNQASKASAAQVPLAILGGMLGSNSVGAVLAQFGAGFAANSILLKYSRTAESQADIMATQILYDSGYDPRAMAQFFEKIQAEDKGGRPQESLRDKGYSPGPIDGILGPQTRAAIREYQKAESLPVTGRLDSETAGKLGVGSESAGGNFKGAGKEIKEGGQEAGHEMKEGKPVAAGKELGKGVGRMGKKIGKGVKKAVDPDSDRGDREKKQEEEEKKDK